MQASGKIIELRQFLAERLPRARFGFNPAPPAAIGIPTGEPRLDAILGGGLPKGDFTELVGNGAGSGSAQVIHALLREEALAGRFVALVDGTDSFDVDAVEPEVLGHLLWVRCQNAEEAMKAADILLRDRNFPLVIVDLKQNPAKQLRKITITMWHRFGRLLEQSGATVLVVTPFALVDGAAIRVEMRSRLQLEALEQSPSELEHRYQLVRAASMERERQAQTG